MTDWTALTATEIAAALALRETTAVAVAEAFLERIAAEDAAIRSFITVSADQALAAARASDLRRAGGHPLHALDGVPVAVKDNIDAAGLPCTGGMELHRQRIPTADAACVSRLKHAGAVLLGKLNLHEGALGATNDNAAYGRCENPVKPGYTPGGSSGGSGAAVAARFCPVALGTDTMGSVRIPAAYCGVMGLKPTYGLVSTRGVMPLSWTLDHVGPLARGVGDLALVTDAMAGWDADCLESGAAPDGWTALYEPAAGAAPLAGVVLGRPAQVDAVGCQPAVLAAFEATLGRLAELGATVRRVDVPGWDPGKARRGGLLLSEAEGAFAHAADMDTRPEGFTEAFLMMLHYGRDAGSLRIVDAQRRVREAGHACDAAFLAHGLDALVMPTAPQAAFPHGAPVPANQADLTALANFSGRPAVSVLMGADADGLPVGLQFVGHRWGEAAILRMADAFTAQH